MYQLLPSCGIFANTIGDSTYNNMETSFRAKLVRTPFSRIALAACPNGNTFAQECVCIHNMFAIYIYIENWVTLGVSPPLLGSGFQCPNCRRTGLHGWQSQPRRQSPEHSDQYHIVNTRTHTHKLNRN